MPNQQWFEYGTSSGNLNQTAYWNNVPSGTSNSYSVTVANLAANTTYYYRAVIQIGDTEFRGSVKSFTTAAAQQPGGWLELPAQAAGANQVIQTVKAGNARNYTMLYDKSLYAPLWTAYPLYSATMENTYSRSSWLFNPDIDTQYQIDVKSSSYGTNYSNSNYSRGHIVPNADRKGNSTMLEQAYYLTNQVPQLQNRFNASIWSNLEGQVRSIAGATDTLYVVTGAAFRKVGGNETINYLHSSSVTPASIPIANYFWKVLLKVKRSGNTITSASAIGVWLDHQEYSSNTAWQSHVVSVDQIEAWTGFNFFVNLPAAIESTAEANTSWTTFSNF